MDSKQIDRDNQQHEDKIQTVMDVKDVEKFLMEQNEALKGFIEKSNQEFEAQGKVSTETKNAINKVSEKCIELADRLHSLEQKSFPGSGNAIEHKTLGRMMIESDGYKAMGEGRQNSCRVNLKDQTLHDLEYKTAIINATGQNQPLVPSDRRPGLIKEPDRMLHMRDLIPAGRTNSNLIEYAKENVFTNNAGPQVGGSPEAFENVTKPESAITFTLATAAVTTLAHFIPASVQVLEDSPMLESYVNTRLMYGLKLYEDTQLLNGSGANGQLTGVWTGKTSYTVASPNLHTTKLDILRKAMTQCQTSNYMAEAYVLNPTDWMDVELAKDSQGRYLFANPQSAAMPRVWGLPVVVSNSMTADRFLVGAWSMASMIFDRTDASVAMSLEDSTNFQKNMVTIRCEERLAHAIFRAAGIIGETFTVAAA